MSSSLGQCLSLAVISLVCLSSFVFWPYSESLIYLYFKYLLLTVCMSFFTWQLWHLRTWRCRFVLKSDGQGKLEGQTEFMVVARPVITPFAVMFDIKLATETRRIVIWADMLDDINYRHLCRLLQLATQ
ncbi:hypothetical protein L2747_02745 [Shewanella marinintestina]|nr:hypothetical protein [Shewanella marinintestina]